MTKNFADPGPHLCQEHWNQTTSNKAMMPVHDPCHLGGPLWEIFVFGTAVPWVQLLPTLNFEPSKEIISLSIKQLITFGG